MIDPKIQESLDNHISQIQTALELDLRYRDLRSFNATLINALFELGVFLRNAFPEKSQEQITSLLNEYSPSFAKLEFPSLTCLAETREAITAYHQQEARNYRSALEVCATIQLGLNSYETLLGKKRIEEQTQADKIESKRIAFSEDYLDLLVYAEEKNRLLENQCQKYLARQRKKIEHLTVNLPSTVSATYQTDGHFDLIKILNAKKQAAQWTTLQNSYPELCLAIEKYHVADEMHKVLMSGRNTLEKIATIKFIIEENKTTLTNYHSTSPNTGIRALVQHIGDVFGSQHWQSNGARFHNEVSKIINNPLPSHIKPHVAPEPIHLHPQMQLAIELGKTMRTLDDTIKEFQALQDQLKAITAAVKANLALFHDNEAASSTGPDHTPSSNHRLD